MGEKRESMNVMSVGRKGDEIRSNLSQRVCGRFEDLEVTWGTPRGKWTKAKAEVGLGGWDLVCVTHGGGPGARIV